MSRRPATELHVEHEIERAYTAKLARHENEIRRIERERHASRIAALCPHPAHLLEDVDFPGCFYDKAPYPAPIAPVELPDAA